MIYRQKYIDAFRQTIKAGEYRFINLVGANGIGKSTFLKECEDFDIFGKVGNYAHISLGAGVSLDESNLNESVSTLIIDSEHNLDIDSIRTFIEPYPSINMVIYTSEKKTDDEEVYVFELPIIGLREYLEHETGIIKIGDIINGSLDIEKLNDLRDLYMNQGGFPTHLLENKSISDDFLEIRANMYQELYEKEYVIFDSFLRTVAMNTGNLFKADQIAKLLDISRRKVNKYTSILLNHNLVKAVGPWVQNTTRETSRHVKLYFSDLSYMKSILGEVHAEGTLRQGALENLIFLELSRKMEDTHTLYYYRKKSGAEITFIAENNEDTLITPIDVTTRSSDVFPQLWRTFESEYHERIERYMLFNDNKSLITMLGDTQVMILPHVGI